MPAAPVAWLPSVPLALEERFCLRHSAQSSRLCYKSEVGWWGQGVGVAQSAGCSGACLGSSPARVGSRLASEGRGVPVYSSSRQRCRESWLSAWPYGRGGAGLGRVPGPGSPRWGAGTSPCSLFLPTIWGHS